MNNEIGAHIDGLEATFNMTIRMLISAIDAGQHPSRLTALLMEAAMEIRLELSEFYAIYPRARVPSAIRFGDVLIGAGHFKKEKFS